MLSPYQLLLPPQMILNELANSPRFREQVRQWLGRPPSPTGDGRAVLHLTSPRLGRRFEWHPQTRRVYLIREDGGKAVGEVIAFDIETHGDAANAVNIWCRGFDEGAAPQRPKEHLQL